MTWLRLDYSGALGGTVAEYLVIDDNGKVSLLLRSARDNGYIGTFEMTLPKARLTRLRQAVRAANLHKLRDRYRPKMEETDFPTLRLWVCDEFGEKQVEVSTASYYYPPELKPLIDVTDRLAGSAGPWPAGILSQLVSEVSNKPLAAISVRLDVAKRSFRVGEGIAVEVVVRNVGTQAVALPSPECRYFADGGFVVELRHVPLPVEEMAGGLDRTMVTFGPHPSQFLAYHEALDDRARADLQHVVRIAPGGEWRIGMPKALVAPSPGEYELLGYWMSAELYDRTLLAKELGGVLIGGRVWPKSVRLRVSK